MSFRAVDRPEKAQRMIKRKIKDSETKKTGSQKTSEELRS